MKKHAVWSSIAVLTAKAVQAVLGVAIVVVLARDIGTAGLGTYAFGMAVANVLAIPLKNGVADLLVRELMIRLSDGSYSIVRGIHLWMMMIVLGFLALSLTIWLLFSPFDTMSNSLLHATIMGILIAPFIAGIGMFGSAIRCFDLPLVAIIPDAVVRPVLMISILALVMATTTSAITPNTALFIQLFACGLSFAGTLASLFFVLRINSFPILGRVETHWMRLFQTCFPFMILGAMQNLNRQVAIIMIGVLLDESAAGIFRVAVQAAMLLLFGIQSIDYVLTPKFVGLSRNTKERNAVGLLGLSILMSMLFAAPILLAYVVWGRAIIDIAFGSDFATAYYPLLLLACANILSLLNGSIVPMLKMSGNEKFLMRTFAIGLLISILLNLLFIPNYGATGAAVSTLLSILFLTVALRLLARNRLQLDPISLSQR